MWEALVAGVELVNFKVEIYHLCDLDMKRPGEHQARESPLHHVLIAQRGALGSW